MVCKLERESDRERRERERQRERIRYHEFYSTELRFSVLNKLNSFSFPVLIFAFVSKGPGII